MDEDDGPADFDTWVLAHGAALLRFAYLITRDHSRAEEAVQDALVAAYARWSRLRELRDPESYVRRCIVNADISRWRRFLRREVPVGDPAALRRSPGATADRAGDLTGDRTADHAADHAEQDAVWRLCASLPPRQRSAVVLRYYEGCSPAEIAEILGCTAGTVRSQLHRALATLRATLSATEEVGQR